MTGMTGRRGEMVTLVTEQHKRIEALETENQGLLREVGRLNQKVDTMVEMAKDLSEKLAICDGSRDRAEAANYKRLLEMSREQVTIQREELSRLRGWIMCKEGRIPELHEPERPAASLEYGGKSVNLPQWSGQDPNIHIASKEELRKR